MTLLLSTYNTALQTACSAQVGRSETAKCPVGCTIAGKRPHALAKLRAQPRHCPQLCQTIETNRENTRPPCKGPDKLLSIYTPCMGTAVQGASSCARGRSRYSRSCAVVMMHCRGTAIGFRQQVKPDAPLAVNWPNVQAAKLSFARWGVNAALWWTSVPVQFSCQPTQVKHPSRCQLERTSITCVQVCAVEKQRPDRRAVGNRQDIDSNACLVQAAEKVSLWAQHAGIINLGSYKGGRRKADL